MKSKNLLIKNGTIVTSESTFKADLYIKNGKFQDIITSKSYNPQEDYEEVDATNKLVLPGGVDAHTHLDMPFMGTSSVDDFKTGSIAAAVGGNTSIIDYAIQQKNSSITESIECWHEKAKGKSVIDYAFHLAVVPPIDNILKNMSEFKKLGVSSIKCFLAYKNSLMIDDISLFKLLKEAAKNDILVCVHAENGELIDYLSNEYIKNDNIQPVYHALSRPAELEEEAVYRVLKFARLANCPVYFVHISTKGAVKAIAKAKKHLQPVYAETCPQYLLLNDEMYNKEGFEGAKYVMSPPLRSEYNQKHLYKYLINKNYFDVIATDHCSFNFNKEKQLGIDNFTKIPNGIPGVETRLPLMFSEMVVKNNSSIEKFVQLNCTNPAKIFNLKNKGDIKQGYDADVAIWDSNLKWKIKSENLYHNVDYTPFENFEVTGKPVTVISRGEIIVSNTHIKADYGRGKYIPFIG